MAVTANLGYDLKLTGDVESQDIFSFVQNAVSPGQFQVIDLASGANTITVPTGGSSVAVACIIFPPNSNTDAITLKGVGGDTGILLHPTNPACISLGAGVTSFVLNAGGAIAGVRFYFV